MTYGYLNAQSYHGCCWVFQALEDNGSGYLVGNSLTLADLGLLECLFNLEDYFGAEYLEDYPLLVVIIGGLLESI